MKNSCFSSFGAVHVDRFGKLFSGNVKVNLTLSYYYDFDVEIVLHGQKCFCADFNLLTWVCIH